jgi:hypothetical protein
MVFILVMIIFIIVMVVITGRMVSIFHYAAFRRTPLEVQVRPVVAPEFWGVCVVVTQECDVEVLLKRLRTTRKRIFSALENESEPFWCCERAIYMFLV